MSAVRLTTVIVAGLLLVISLSLAARLNNPLREARREYGIAQADPLVNAPPLVSFTTIALGAFRGIVADMLWLRAARLQEEGRYFELVQLADWITKLEPRFTSIWAFHAWNLAYNISVLLESPEDRWRWVRHGISLLRDEGIRYNPGDARLLFELGWLFQHKVAGDLDTAHMHYKKEWAGEMARLWEGPTPDFDALLRAASTRAELLARPGVADLIERLHQAGRVPFSLARVEEARHAPADDPLRSPPGKELVDFLRRREMVEQYKLELALMREIDETYGPLDWRLPQAHAMYWAWQSRKVARRDFDRLSADRMLFQSMADALRQGRLTWDPARDLFILSPNPDLVWRVQRAYLDALDRHPDNETVKTAHLNFMREATVICYTFNRLPDARRLYDDLRARYPEAVGGRSFETFVQDTYLERNQRLGLIDARAIVEGALFQSEFWRSIGDEDRAAGFLRLARATWERHQQRASASPDLLERIGLPPFEDIRRTAAQRARDALARPRADWMF